MATTFEGLTTPRLVLEPVDERLARAILAGDLQDLTPAEGWPHDDTKDGLAMAIAHGQPAGWLVNLDGETIGDCGTHGPPDAAGVVEIGYGLAAPFRGRGYGSEVVAAITTWLLSRPDVRVVKATVLSRNAASRRVLEKAGFLLVAEKRRELVYEISSAPSSCCSMRCTVGLGMPVASTIDCSVNGR
jgi:RimJ/RimL family protein N-acetyltransferase